MENQGDTQLNIEPMRFETWGGQQGLEQFIINETGTNPFSGAGINIRNKEKIAILKSVDDTPHYPDDMNDINNPQYTLFGHNGDQSPNEKRFNEPLLNKDKIEYIYLYRVIKNGKKTIYLWYGKYYIDEINYKLHPGMDKIIRTVIVLSLKRSI